MHLIITGICGFAGCTIATELLAAISGLKITGIDNLMRPGSELNRPRLKALGVKVIHGDVRSASDFELLPDADWLIDAAANPSVLAGLDGRSGARQTVEHNFTGTLNMLEYCRRVKAGFLLLSTSRVYSIPPLAGMPLTDSGTRYDPDTSASLPCGLSASGIAEHFSTQAPVSLYGSTKICSEALALEYGAAFGFPVRVHRCGVLAGAGQFGTAEQGIFSYWLHAWRARRPLRYIGFDGQGKQVRDAFHPVDLARLICSQLRDPGNPAPPVLNAGGGLANSMSLQQLSAWCADRFGAHAVQSDTAPRPFDLPWVVMDSAAVQRAWDWQPQRSLTDILEEIARHAEENPDWLQLTAP